MDYDWTGIRTRRLMLFKWTSLVLATGFPITFLLWLQLSH